MVYATSKTSARYSDIPDSNKVDRKTAHRLRGAGFQLVAAMHRDAKRNRREARVESLRSKRPFVLSEIQRQDSMIGDAPHDSGGV